MRLVTCAMRTALLSVAALVLLVVASEAFSTGTIAPSLRPQRHQLSVRVSHSQLVQRRQPTAAAPPMRMGLPGFPLGGGGGILNVGTPELLVIGGLAWILLGPKELLRLSREAGILIGKLRKLGTEAADQFRDAIEAEVSFDEIEQEKRAIEASMAQIRTGKKPPTPADDIFGSALADEEVVAPKKKSKSKSSK